MSKDKRAKEAKEIHLLQPVDPRDMDSLRKSFSEVDANKDGFISKDELSQAMTFTGQKVSTAELDRMYQLVDKNGDGLLDFEEFMALMEGNCLCESTDREVEQLFRMFDLDDDGFITESELANMMVKLGEQVRKKDIRRMIKLGDKNKDKQLSLEEFKDMISKSQLMGEK